MIQLHTYTRSWMAQAFKIFIQNFTYKYVYMVMLYIPYVYTICRLCIKSSLNRCLEWFFCLVKLIKKTYLIITHIDFFVVQTFQIRLMIEMKVKMRFIKTEKQIARFRMSFTLRTHFMSDCKGSKLITMLCQFKHFALWIHYRIAYLSAHISVHVVLIFTYPFSSCGTGNQRY